jgi:hypothetical protein
MKPIDVIMLDGSNLDAAMRTLWKVCIEAPVCFFSTAHLCVPTPPKFCKLQMGLVHGGALLSQAVLHVAPIEYGNRLAYSRYVIEELPKFLEADHFMTLHRDGFPVNWSKWSDDFLAYDFCGAPWSANESEAPVGNGGFSVRSKRLALWLQKQPIDWSLSQNEDWQICSIMRQRVIEAGFTFAPVSVAARFSLENDIAELPRKLEDCFGFHGTANRLNLLL